MENGPINIVYLILLAITLFIMGYRFYAKFLGLAVFPNSQYSPEEQNIGQEEPLLPLGVRFGHHIASLVAGTTLIGSAVALLWGWVPAFLWLVTGTVIGAGTYGMAALWISHQFPDKNLSEIVDQLLGRTLGLVFGITAIILLFLLSGASLWLAASMLEEYPELVVLFWLQLALACTLGRFWQRNRFRHLSTVAIAYLGLVVLAVTVLGQWAVGFSGSLSLDILGQSRLSVDAKSLWIVLLLLSVWFVQRRSLTHVARPRAWMVSVQVFLFIGLLLAALLISHPNIQAPQFYRAEHSPGLWPWLFLTITSGALAGFHALVANGISSQAASQDRRSTRLLGYGGAIADGTLALVVVFIVITQFESQEAWKNIYATWDLAKQPEQLVGVIATGATKTLGVLGFGEHFSRIFTLITILGILITTVDACASLIRGQLRFLGNRFRLVPFKAKRTRGMGVSLITVLFIVFASKNNDILAGGSMYGLLGNTIGLLVSMSVFYWLWKKHLWPWPMALIGLWFLVITLSAWISSGIHWWQADQLTPLAPLLLVAIVLTGLMFLSVRWWLSHRAAVNLTHHSDVSESD